MPFSIAALLAAADEAEFAFVRDSVEISDSALSKQASALEAAGYVAVRKGFVGRFPRTWLSLTPQGRAGALPQHRQMRVVQLRKGGRAQVRVLGGGLYPHSFGDDRRSSDPTLHHAGVPCSALRSGGGAPAVLNAANEVAVESFLAGRLRFTAIAQVIEETMQRVPCGAADTLDAVLDADRRARRSAEASIAALFENAA